MGTRSYTAIIEKEGARYVALCPELDVASQGETVESATANLKEAVELFLECADPAEVERRLHTQIGYRVSHFHITLPKAQQTLKLPAPAPAQVTHQQPLNSTLSQTVSR